MVTPPEVRAEVLRVMLALTGGIPEVDPGVASLLAARRLTSCDVNMLDAQSPEDLALLNSCLAVEHDARASAFDTLERLLPLLQWSDGELQQRVLALPAPLFARAALALYELGWVTSTKED